MRTSRRTSTSWLLLLSLLCTQCTALDISRCILHEVSPRLGPTGASTNVTVSVKVLGLDSADTPASLRFTYNDSSQLVGSLVSTTASATDLGEVVLYLVQLPELSLASQVLLHSQDCSGSLAYTLYNVDASDFDIPISTLRMTGGSSLKVRLLQESVWTGQVDALYVHLVSPSDPSLSVLMSLSQTSPTHRKVILSPKTYVTTTDNRLAVFGATDTRVLVSLNNQNFLQLPQRVAIVPSTPLQVLFLYDNYVTDLGREHG